MAGVKGWHHGLGDFGAVRFGRCELAVARIG